MIVEQNDGGIICHAFADFLLIQIRRTVYIYIKEYLQTIHTYINLHSFIQIYLYT